MKQSVLFNVLSLSLLLLFSCNDANTECVSDEIAITSLEEEYNCENTENLLDIDLEEAFAIITTQDEFENKVLGDCAPQIDFDSFDLLIGKKAFAQGNDSIAYQLVENCKSNVLQLSVVFLQNDTTEAPNLTYHVLLPKLEQNKTVEVTIVVQ